MLAVSVDKIMVQSRIARAEVRLTVQVMIIVMLVAYVDLIIINT